MALNTESKLARVWLELATCALSSGASAHEARDRADCLTMAYDARFGEPADHKLGATVMLKLLLEFRERHSLIGMLVTVAGQIDVPWVGKILDFSDGDKVYAESVKIKWESGSSDESWVPIDKVQVLFDMR
jgi:hypothetical protein